MGVIARGQQSIRRRPCRVPLKRGHHLGAATYLLRTTSDEMVTIVDRGTLVSGFHVAYHSRQLVWIRWSWCVRRRL